MLLIVNFIIVILLTILIISLKVMAGGLKVLDVASAKLFIDDEVESVSKYRKVNKMKGIFGWSGSTLKFVARLLSWVRNILFSYNLLVCIVTGFMMFSAVTAGSYLMVLDEEEKSEETEESVSTGNNEEKVSSEKIIWVGDSRTVGMSSAKGGDTDKDIYIAKISEGYDFLKNSVPDVTSKISKGDNIVVNMGVNDIGNVDKYIELLNSLVENEWKDANVYYMSVNPVIDSTSRYVKNSQIESFNEKMKSSLDESITWIDTYSSFDSNWISSDGIHYTPDGYKELYDMVRERI